MTDMIGNLLKFYSNAAAALTSSLQIFQERYHTMAWAKWSWIQSFRRPRSLRERNGTASIATNVLTGHGHGAIAWKAGQRMASIWWRGFRFDRSGGERWAATSSLAPCPGAPSSSSTTTPPSYLHHVDLLAAVKLVVENCRSHRIAAVNYCYQGYFRQHAN